MAADFQAMAVDWPAQGVPCLEYLNNASDGKTYFPASVMITASLCLGQSQLNEAVTAGSSVIKVWKLHGPRCIQDFDIGALANRMALCV